MIETSEPKQTEKKNITENPAWYRAMHLVERATNWRTQPTTLPALQPQFNAKQAARHLQHWKEQAPFNRGAFFADRLAIEGLSVDDFYQLLGETAETVQTRNPITPAWLLSLAAAFESFDPTNLTPLPEVANKQPGVLALLTAIEPLIRYGLNRVQNGVAELAQSYEQLPFDPQTVAKLVYANLPSQLTNRISQVLALEVNVARLHNQLRGETADERFYNWVHELGHQGGILAILDEYPVLARQLSKVIDTWANTSLEFLNRLCVDWLKIKPIFTSTVEPGVLVEINGGAGDLHRGGRSVLILTFSSGFKLLYKPKSLAIDTHFQELLEWLNARGDHHAFRTISILDRGEYGWTEFVAAQGCRTVAEIERFYERQGGYLALLYALEATDFHYENLIAAGEHPVLIDLEALFHPRVGDNNLSQADVLAATTLGYSVLRVGLLPRRAFSSDKSVGVDVSGLNGKAGQRSPRPVATWKNWGTDQMRMVREYVEMQGSQNRPKLIEGETETQVEVLDYKDKVLLGFKRVYRLLMAQRDELLSGPIANFAHDEIRIVLRATRSYAILLYESFHPDLMRDALDRDRLFDRLWVSVEKQPYLARVVSFERDDLLNGDIPMFTTRPDTCDIFGSQGQAISHFFEEPSLNVVRQCLQRLDERDLNLQSWFIEASFATITMGTDTASWIPSRLLPSETKVSSERLIALACSIGDRLEQLAIRVDNEVSWIGLSLFQERDWTLLPAGADLYNGAAGVTLFLAYLGQATGEKRYRILADSALVSLRRQIDQLKDLKLSIGAFDGWGGVVYLLSHLGSLWNDPALYEEALAAMEYLGEQIENDQNFDIIGGASGAILATLSLYRASGDKRALAMAVRCGEHLLSKAERMPRGLGWKAFINKETPLTGFSHGVAGIGYSLLALAEASADERFYQTALAAFEYERGFFSPAEQNWPDLREDTGGGAKSFMNTWCHGAAGIGLGRLAALEYVDDAAIRAEIEAALNTTLNKGFGMNHSICHGDLGNLETILTATLMLADTRYCKQLEDLTAAIVDSLDKYGPLTGVPLGVETPGLMSGISGIGYQLLRLAQPQAVPAVLLVAPPLSQRNSTIDKEITL